MADNPYLAHRQKSKKGAEDAASSTSEPLFGFLPRKVKGDQVRKAMARLSTFQKRTEELKLYPTIGKRYQSLH